MIALPTEASTNHDCLFEQQAPPKKYYARVTNEEVGLVAWCAMELELSEAPEDWTGPIISRVKSSRIRILEHPVSTVAPGAQNLPPFKIMSDISIS